MSVFTVELENKPGELARLCEAMADNQINLVLSAMAREDKGTVAFVADDEAAAQAALEEAGLRYAMRPALTIQMENQPGAGATAFRMLANAGVNTDLLLPIRVSEELFFAVVCVDDEEKARQALGDKIATASTALASDRDRLRHRASRRPCHRSGIRPGRGARRSDRG